MEIVKIWRHQSVVIHLVDLSNPSKRLDSGSDANPLGPVLPTEVQRTLFIPLGPYRVCVLCVLSALPSLSVYFCTRMRISARSRVVQ